MSIDSVIETGFPRAGVAPAPIGEPSTDDARQAQLRQTSARDGRIGIDPLRVAIWSSFFALVAAAWAGVGWVVWTHLL